MKNLILLFIMFIVLAACTPTDNPTTRLGEVLGTTGDVYVDLPLLGIAPEIENSIWINSERALRLSDLRGKVVLLEMWTFGCINCQNVIPSLKTWHSKYAEEGLVIIGNHYPEFAHEHDLDNLKAAVEQMEIEYPVAQDNDGKTWRAYNNRYWPALFLIDKSGNIRYTHIGEGAYTKTEQAIQALLSEPWVASNEQ